MSPACRKGGLDNIMATKRSRSKVEVALAGQLAELKSEAQAYRELVEEHLERLDGAVGVLIAAADEIEFCYRNRGLNAIRDGGAENPLFTDLFRAIDAAKQAHAAYDRIESLLFYFEFDEEGEDGSE